MATRWYRRGARHDGQVVAAEARPRLVEPPAALTSADLRREQDDRAARVARRKAERAAMPGRGPNGGPVGGSRPRRSVLPPTEAALAELAAREDLDAP